MKKLAYIFSIFCFCSGCDKNNTAVSDNSESATLVSNGENKKIELMPLDYVKWVQNESNGIYKSKIIGEVKYILQYKPHDYLACMELKSDSVKKADLQKKEDDFKGMVYFDFKIHIPQGNAEFLKYGVSSTSEYQQRVSYSSFGMQYDICMVQSKDTIPCKMYLFERSFDVTPEGTFLLGFDEKAIDTNKEITFLFNDKLFRKGSIKFTFGPKTLLNIPKLKTV